MSLHVACAIKRNTEPDLPNLEVPLVTIFVKFPNASVYKKQVS